MAVPNERSEAPEFGAAKSSDREITATRVFDAPREMVWEAWTDPQQISRWWGPNGFSTTTSEMDIRPGGRWRHVMHGPDGRDYDNEITYVEVDKPNRLVYEHGPTPKFRVTVNFIAEGDRTRLNMRMLFESAAVRNKVAAEYGAVEGLSQTLGRLTEYLEKTDVAPDATPFVITRVFDAPIHLMWTVWTEPDRLAQWFGPKGVTVFHSKNDLRPGGIYHYGMRTPDGGEMWGRWVYREIVKPERLVFVLSFSDANGGVTRAPFEGEWPLEILSTITFAEENAKTRVTVRWVPVNATEAERRTFNAEQDSMNAGWTGTFEQLADYLSSAGERQ